MNKNTTKECVHNLYRAIANLHDNTAHAWHNQSSCPAERLACLLDAELGSYCDINSTDHKYCEEMYTSECIEKGGIPRGAGSRCREETDADGNKYSCHASIADVWGSCCYGDDPKNKKCKWIPGAFGNGPDTAECECTDKFGRFNGVWYPEKECEELRENGACPQTVRPKPRGPIHV